MYDYDCPVFGRVVRVAELVLRVRVQGLRVRLRIVKG